MNDNLAKDNETISQVVTRIIENHDKAKTGIPIGVELGWQSTRGKIVLEETDVMVVGGRPAMGKTAWLVSAIKKLVFDQEKDVVVFSLEMSKDQIIRRLIAQLCDIDSNSIKLGQCTYEEIQRIFAISGSPLFERLHLFDGSHTILEIAQKTSEIKNSRNVDLVMIDYLQKVTPEKSGERYQEVTRISNGIKKMTMTMRIPTIALAQLSRDSGKTGRRPTLPDLKESGEIEQDASIVAFLHRPEYYGDLYDDMGNSNSGRGEFIIAKNRDGSNGIIDMSVDLSRSAWVDFKGYPDDYVKPETNDPF
jgi:replicative DNA helicase